MLQNVSCSPTEPAKVISTFNIPLMCALKNFINACLMLIFWMWRLDICIERNWICEHWLEIHLPSLVVQSNMGKL